MSPSIVFIIVLVKPGLELLLHGLGAPLVLHHVSDRAELHTLQVRRGTSK